MTAAPHFGRGLASILGCVLIWGVQFPVAKSALGAIDSVQMNAVRYGIGTLLLLAILFWRDGPRALDFPGGLGRIAVFGFLGMGASPLLLFYGLSLSQPEHTAIIVSLQPAMTALADWWLQGRRPANFTLAAIAAAFLGMVAVVTKGEPTLPAGGGAALFGDLVVILAALCWVAHALGTEIFRGRSALQLTVLSLLSGTCGIWGVAAVGLGFGWIAPASPATLIDIGWQLGYLSLAGVLLGMLLWTAGFQHIGALNAMLLLNMTPVVTLAVTFALGARYSGVELCGAALVVGALAANNVYLRRKLRVSA